jgi:trans-aconitate methyltransferase
MTADSAPSDIIRTIHPDDGMWQPNESWYFATGRSALRVVDLAVRASWLPRVGSVLDLPCGYGRVTRHLRAAYPDATLYCSDLLHEGARFCAETFDGVAIPSQPELTEVPLPMVDVIWVGSLFTHLDLDRTTRWLRYLCEHLNPDGVIAASFHGEWALQMQRIYRMIGDEPWAEIVAGYTRTGYGYAPYPGRPDYGVSVSSPHVVIDLIRDIPGVRLAGYMERGWADNHDVAMIARDDRARPWTPDFRSRR